MWQGGRAARGRATEGRTEISARALSLSLYKVASSARASPALAAGSVDVAPLVHDRIDLAHAERALARTAEPGVLKVLVETA